MVKNLPANANDTRLIPGLGRSPGGKKKKMAVQFIIFAWEIQWTEESGGL